MQFGAGQAGKFQVGRETRMHAVHGLARGHGVAELAQQVHARALSLILANDCQGGEAVDQMLAGLRAVAEQAVHPG